MSIQQSISQLVTNPALARGFKKTIDANERLVKLQEDIKKQEANLAKREKMFSEVEKNIFEGSEDFLNKARVEKGLKSIFSEEELKEANKAQKEAEETHMKNYEDIQKEKASLLEKKKMLEKEGRNVK